MNSIALIRRLTANPASHPGEEHESATFRLPVPRTPTPTNAEVPPGTPDKASAGRQTSGGADFIDIVCFDKLAATCAEYLTRGWTGCVANHVSTVGRAGSSSSTWVVQAERIDALEVEVARLRAALDDTDGAAA